jgi:SAM-dependent methyltransferase
MNHPAADRSWSGAPEADTDGPAGDPLGAARDADGHSPRSWLEASSDGADRPVVALRPGPGRGVLLAVGPGRAVADHRSLPFRAKTVPAVVLDMCLPALDGVDDLFAELRRILRPAGTVAALVPLRPGFSTASRRDAACRHAAERALGGRPTFRNESARDHLHWLFAAADFAVLTDQRRTFRLPLPDPPAAGRAVDALVDGGFWPRGLDPARLDAARRALADRAGDDRSLPLRLRLLVARR